MAVTLRILDVKYNQRGEYIDDAWYKGDISKAKLIKKKTFKGYIEMAEWLEKHKKYKWNVMFVRTANMIGLSKKVVFNGISVWVEDYGLI